MPKVQHALFIKEKQGPFVLDSTEIDSPGSGEVLLKIHAIGLNHIDGKIQKFSPPGFVKSYPTILGSDAAGVVEEIGDGVIGFQKGNRVLYQGAFGDIKRATFKQYTLAPASILAKLPDDISFDEGASIPTGLITAATGLYTSKELGGVHPAGLSPGAGLTAPWADGGAGKYKGEGILVVGGSGSVGQYAIQLARMSGFSPIATTSSLGHAALLKNLGATHVIDRNRDLVSEAKKVFGDSPPRIVFDAVASPETQTAAFEVLARDGQLVAVSPPVEGVNGGKDGKSFSQPFGSAHFQRKLAEGLYANVYRLLQAKDIQPCRVEVLPGGLNAIAGGLARLEKNAGSFKLIVRPNETN